MRTSTKIIITLALYIGLYSVAICTLAHFKGDWNLGFAYFGFNIPLMLIFIGCGDWITNTK